MAEALGAGFSAQQGTTGRLWRKLRGPVELVFVDPGASGELLAARVRVHIAVLLIAIHALSAWSSGLDVLILALTMVVLAYAVVIRAWAATHYTTMMGYATSLVDVSAVTLSLALMIFDKGPSEALHAMVRFQLYFLAILTSSLKMNWRVSAMAGAFSAIQYALLLAVGWSLGWPASDWPQQIGRLGTLLGAGYLGTVVVLRAQQLRDLSTRDFLTGLANRAVLDGRLSEEVSRARRHQRRFAVALVDIDHFKRFNDRYGHPQGDVVLRTLAGVLKSAVRESDLVARYGGEEFALVLPEAGVAEARAKLEAIRGLVEMTSFDGADIALLNRVTLSAGVAEFPSDGDSPEDLLAIADARLYEAKRGGRNRVVTFSAISASRSSPVVLSQTIESRGR
jgi:diguanylate cyclase (GGDEF)-like protein